MGGGIGAVLNPTVSLGKKTIGAAVKKFLPVAPEVPTLPGMPTAPDKGDAEVQAAKKKERKLARLRSGRQSTILSNLRQQLSPGRQGGGTQLG